MSWQDRKHSDTLVLFDVDGTLTQSRQLVKPEMLACLRHLRQQCVIGFVGGSDLAKQQEQLGTEGMALFDFQFAENGLTAYRSQKLLASQSFIGWLGEEKYARMVNFILRYIADLQIPIKRCVPLLHTDIYTSM